MSIEDVFQIKNLTVTDVSAPSLDLYPEGYVDTPKLPLALTWVMSTALDESATRKTSQIQIDVLVRPVGQSRLRKTKRECQLLRDLFMTAYTISGANAYIQNDPAVRIIPGTLIFGGYRELITAPDETPYHGFTITLTAEEHIGVTC